jgi:hypothetical protein
MNGWLFYILLCFGFFGSERDRVRFPLLLLRLGSAHDGLLFGIKVLVGHREVVDADCAIVGTRDDCLIMTPRQERHWLGRALAK